jgi:hypothetical protein
MTPEESVVVANTFVIQFHTLFTPATIFSIMILGIAAAI